MLKQEVGTFPGPSDVYPMPLPLFTRTHTWVITALIYLADVGYAGQPTAWGFRKRRGWGGREGAIEAVAAGGCRRGVGENEQGARGLGWGRGGRGRRRRRRGRRREDEGGKWRGERAFDRPCRDNEEIRAFLHETQQGMPCRYRFEVGYKHSKGAFLPKEGGES